MQHRFITYILLIALLPSCRSKQQSKVKKLTEVKVTEIKTAQKTTKTSTYQTAKANAYHWTTQLDFNMDYIVSKKLADKKHLAELLGLYWKLHKATDDDGLKKEIKDQVQPLYNYILKPKYHNMSLVSDKLFKKNSMSYLRVMWLFQRLDFDISTYQKEVKKIMPRMNTHLKIRGTWQKEVFKEYYTFFNYKMPNVLKLSKPTNGVIDQKHSFEKYDKAATYKLTHFVFAAFEYGNKTTQNRFDSDDLAYLNELLPKLTQKYRSGTPNIDLLGELFTCMVYLNNTNTTEVETTYQYLLTHQNKNGSWGLYEKHRKRLGKDVDIRAYLHTTLVVLEGLIAYNEETFAGALKHSNSSKR